MSVLRVDGAQLDAMSTQIMSAVSQTRLGPELSRADESVLGSPDVATALREGSRQQHLRAETTADALSAVGESPRGAVTTFAEADTSLARAF